MADTQQKQSGTQMLANVLAIAGSIILVVIIIWGLIHLFSLSGGFFSSLFGNKDSGFTVSAPSEVTSGEITQISWSHDTKEPGMYALLYPCTDGLRFSTPAPDHSMITMPCGAAFAIGSATTTATILPMLTASSSVTTPFSVLFIPSSTSSVPAEATVTLTVNPRATAPQAPVQPESPTTPAQTPQSPPVSQGPADLAVTITSVSIDQYGSGTVTFNISNIGKGASGSYMFTAQIPTAQPYTYVSPSQVSLSPGSYIINTLRFTQAVSGSVSIFVDTAGSVREANEGNNTAVQYVTGQYPYNYNYQYGQQYNQYNYNQQYYYPYTYDIYNYPYAY